MADDADESGRNERRSEKRQAFLNGALLAALAVGLTHRAVFLWVEDLRLDWNATGTWATAFVAAFVGFYAIRQVREMAEQNRTAKQALVESLAPRLRVVSARIGQHAGKTPMLLTLVLCNEGPTAAVDVFLTGVLRVGRPGEQVTTPHQIVTAVDGTDGDPSLAMWPGRAEPQIESEVVAFVVGWEPRHGERLTAFCDLVYRSANDPVGSRPRVLKFAAMGEALGVDTATPLLARGVPFATRTHDDGSNLIVMRPNER